MLIGFRKSNSDVVGLQAWTSPNTSQSPTPTESKNMLNYSRLQSPPPGGSTISPKSDPGGKNDSNISRYAGNTAMGGNENLVHGTISSDGNGSIKMT